jgi:hypothetical protein
MPQAIAMQLPVTAAATPAATVALATTGSVASKTPRFAGLLLQLGRMASPSAPSAAEPAVANKSNAPVDAGQQSAQPEPPATRVADQAPPTPEPDLPAIPSLMPTPAPATAPGPFILPRPTVAAHPRASQEPAATAASAAGSAVVASAAPTPTPIPAMPPPTGASVPPPPPQPPADSQTEGPKHDNTRLGGVAVKPDPTAAAPPQNEAASDRSTATVAPPTTALSPGPPSAPAAAVTTQANASPVQAVLAPNQQEQSAGPGQLPDRVPAASAVQPDAGAAAPAQQVSAALVSLAGAPGGGQRMTLRLEPAELGLVQIRIDRPQDAPAQVDISVQRPETLTLLLRDQPQLQRALDQAGVPADGRSVTLHVTAPDSTTSSSSVTAGAAASADLGQSGGHGAGTRSGGQGRSGDAADQDPDDTSTPLPRWLRAGLDITA